MDLRALATVLALVSFSACSDTGSDTGSATTGDMSTGTGDTTSTGHGTTTGATTTTGTPTSSDGSGTATTGGSNATTVGPTTGEPGTTTDATTTSTTGAGGCAPGNLGPGDHTVMVEHGGMQREAIVHVPPFYDPDTPTSLVLNFHGYTGNPQNQIALSGMNVVADAENFIVAYPDGLYQSWNAGQCCGQAVSDDIDDVGFVRALVAELHDELCIDPKRVYSAGMSNGGYISHRLACEAADLIAAAGPVSSVLVFSPCEPSRPVPLMMFNGTGDFIVPYNGGIYQSAPKTFADWAALDGCTDQPEVTSQVGGVTCETYDECQGGATVTLCTVEDMGHCWPGNPECTFGTPNVDIDASEALWQFFAQNSLP